MKDGAKNVYLTFHEIMCGVFLKNTSCNSFLCYIFPIWVDKGFMSYQYVTTFFVTFSKPSIRFLLTLKDHKVLPWSFMTICCEITLLR
jgi:hypothetical protein